MIFWLDAHLSPKLAPWIEKHLGVSCKPVRELNLQFASDQEIFNAARKVKAIVISKDRDFQEMVLRMGSPPQILWITCGNTSTTRMQAILEKALPEAIKLFNSGEELVEIIGG
ncbi:MAG: DUF5615 family PIN-like protein [Bdellovibrionia bacterium]